MGFSSMIIFGTVVITVMLVVSAAPPSGVKELSTTNAQQDKAKELLVIGPPPVQPVVPDTKNKTPKTGVSVASKSLATKDEALKSAETAGFVYGYYTHYPYSYYYNYPYYYL